MALNNTYIIGEILAIYFHNPDNHFRVMRIKVEDTNTLYSEKFIVVTGYFLNIQEGTSYQFYGELIDHPRYGQQFNCYAFEPVQIMSLDGLIRYLSSAEFPGIGKTLAERIVSKLGAKAIERILNEADALDNIRGLNKNKQILLKEKLKASQGSQYIFIRLAEWGFSTQLANRIYLKYQHQAIEIIEANPYQLTRDIPNFGFKRADQLAKQLALPLDSQERISGAVFYLLYQHVYTTGDTYLHKEALLKAALDLLNPEGMRTVSYEQLYQGLKMMLATGEICAYKQTYLAVPWLYYAEKGSARILLELKEENNGLDFSQEQLLAVLKEVESDLNVSYGQEQRLAIEEALRSSVYILTGGPGTGKTTILNGLVRAYQALKKLSGQELEEVIALAAPTGRAAKRMSDVIDFPAKTIHRLLGLTGEEEVDDIDVSSAEVDYDLLIIDEVSMVDCQLLYQLLQAVTAHTQIVFVGDKDQLPSVGPGQILGDLLASQQIPHRELKEIYRQKEKSSIITLAHAIKEGRMPADFSHKFVDRTFIPASNRQLPHLVAQVAKKAEDKGYTSRDIQVLAPLYAGQSGIDNLNRILQAVLNPNSDGQKRELVHQDIIFRVGDKVLQLKNQAEYQVFNGDLGRISAIFFAKETESKSDTILVEFDDGLEVTYQRSDFHQLTLAYCTSIHKAQGSEFPIVILPLVKAYWRMLQRNLLYTAVTRAKHSLILCGEVPAFKQAVATLGGRRETLLAHFLCDKGQERADEELEVRDDIWHIKAEHGDQTEELGLVNVEGGNDKIQTASSIMIEENKPDHGQNNVSDVSLSSGIDRQEDILTPEMVESGQFNPLRGIEGLSPYQF